MAECSDCENLDVPLTRDQLEEVERSLQRLVRDTQIRAHGIELSSSLSNIRRILTRLPGA